MVFQRQNQFRFPSNGETLCAGNVARMKVAVSEKRIVLSGWKLQLYLLQDLGLGASQHRHDNCVYITYTIFIPIVQYSFRFSCALNFELTCKLIHLKYILSICQQYCSTCCFGKYVSNFNISSSYRVLQPTCLFCEPT